MENKKELTEKYVGKLKTYQTDPDSEQAHSDGDVALCELLKELGFDEVVKEFGKVKKWYS